MDVDGAIVRERGVDVVEDAHHVRDRRRPEVDDRMRDPTHARSEQVLVRCERIGRVRQVDEHRHSAVREGTETTLGRSRVWRSGVFTGQQALRDEVALGDRRLHLSTHASRDSCRGAGVRSPCMDADAIELRVLGCLLEKQRTTPDQYPLSLNALRLACNQTTNRDPVVAYDEGEIHDALQRLARRGWTRLASGAGSRAAKYRQLFETELGLADAEAAVLCVLMLRGAQTPGELKQRTERLHRFEGLPEIQQTLDGLTRRELVERLDRRPGQKEERYRHLLGGDQPAGAIAADPALAATLTGPDLEARVAAVEAELRTVRGELDAIRARLPD